MATSISGLATPQVGFVYLNTSEVIQFKKSYSKKKAPLLLPGRQRYTGIVCTGGITSPTQRMFWECSLGGLRRKESRQGFTVSRGRTTRVPLCQLLRRWFPPNNQTEAGINY